MLVRGAAVLLAASVSTATTGALPVPHAAAVVSVVVAGDGDTDGDGLPDTGDGCPTVASTNPTGCPTAPRRAALTWLGGAARLQVQVTSPVTSCAARARLVLWRVRADRDVKLAGVIASRHGRHRFRVPRGATYYVTVAPSYSSGEAECAKAVSRRVRVPRS
ncbi:MAG: hypothetical protein JWN97_1909 [Nocardioides sp.]|nr:hypothetical protein [Nocardioides sp.]